jgi:hypothetical protein
MRFAMGESGYLHRGCGGLMVFALTRAMYVLTQTSTSHGPDRRIVSLRSEATKYP